MRGFLIFARTLSSADFAASSKARHAYSVVRPTLSTARAMLIADR